LKFAADGSFVYNPSVASAWVVINDDNIVEIPGGAKVNLK